MLNTNAGELHKLKFYLGINLKGKQKTFIHFYIQKPDYGFINQHILEPDIDIFIERNDSTPIFNYPLKNVRRGTIIKNRLEFEVECRKKLGAGMSAIYSKKTQNHILVPNIKSTGGVLNLKDFPSQLTPFFNFEIFRTRYHNNKMETVGKYYLDYHLFIEYFLNNAKIYGKKETFFRDYYNTQSKLHGTTNMV